MQKILGDQIELTLVTLMQNSAKITKSRQIGDILGKFVLYASSCIHFYRKETNFRQKVQKFVGGQNELILVTLM